MIQLQTQQANPRTPRQPVLIVTHADGYFEVFGRDIDVHVATMAAMDDVAGELVADDYLGITLPDRFRKIYFPGLIKTTGQVRDIRPRDIAYRELRLSMLRAMETIKQGAPAWTA